MINIVIAEDHNSLIDGIDIFFKLEEDINIVGKVNDGRTLLEFLNDRNRHVNIVIIDIRMPNVNGIEATKLITEKYPHIKVIAFTMYRQQDFVDKMTAAGAKGYLLKNARLPVLLEAVRAVYNGEIYYDSDLSLYNDSSTTEIKKEKLLTKTQNQILDLCLSLLDFQYPD